MTKRIRHSLRACLRVFIESILCCRVSSWPRLDLIRNKMAADWVRKELQVLAGSTNSHKDSVEKYRKIFQKIIKSDAKVLIGGLRDFIESGRP